jgi:outer membrane protein OmpA-like peptidoglycan-associated protein
MDLYRARKFIGSIPSDSNQDDWTKAFQRLRKMGVPVVLWHEAVNLGYPLNTHADEMGFVLEANGNSGWMSRPYQGRIVLHRIGLAKSALPLMDPEILVLAQIPDSTPSSKQEQEWILRDIYFEVNAAFPLPASMASLLQLAAWIKKNPELRIEIQGHTDNTGNNEKNRILSQQRADAVLRTLIRQGCAASQLIAVGYGSSRPIAGNNSVEGRALNRRTQIKILPK